MSASAYLASPWPGEDGGPERLQVPRSGAGLALRPGEKLGCVTRNTLMSTMTVLGSPGEVYLLTHSAIRAKLGLPTTACVELIDAQTLRPVRRSPRLSGGPMWPGGLAIHRNGDLYVVYGRYAHRLNRACEPRASLQLPVNQPYNSFVILDNGLMVDTGTRALTPLWQKAPFGCASHMIHYPDTGELVINDYRKGGEEVAVLSIQSGEEIARVRSGGLNQGVVFPSVGWNRDFYWSSMGRVARVFVY